jgi:hypothetical protein
MYRDRSGIDLLNKFLFTEFTGRGNYLITIQFLKLYYNLDLL